MVDDAKRDRASEALATMNRALRVEYDGIRDALVAVASDEIRSRYRVGKIVEGVLGDGARYGAHAVDRLAAALGLARRTLYRHARVAAAWTPRDLSAFERLRDCIGQPLTWSHLVPLTERFADREAWIEKTLAGAWSARRLEREMGLGQAPSTSGELSVEASTRSAILRTIRHTSRWNADLGGSMDALLERLAELPAWDAETGLLCERLAAACAESHKRSGDVLARLARLREEAARTTGEASSPRLKVGAPIRATKAR